MSTVKWIPIMRTGVHVDSNGVEHSFDEARLDAIAASYDPARHEAPVVIGHPTDNAPAFAWVAGMKRDGNTLFYQEKGAQSEFDEMRKKGLFKKRSLSLYPDGTLRHVGWLGAMPPAIKGLADVAFAETGTIIEFSETAPGGDKSKEGRSMKFMEWLKGEAAKQNVTLEDLPPTFSEADVKAAAAKAAKEAQEKAAADFAEERKKQDASFAEREKALKARETEARTKGVAEFTESLKKAGKVTPAMEKLGMGVTSFMQALIPVETVIEFGEGADKKKQTPLEFMQAFLSALPPQIAFSEIAGFDKDVKTGGAGEKLDASAREKMKANKALTYGAAFTEAQIDNPQLATEYAAELRG